MRPMVIAFALLASLVAGNAVADSVAIVPTFRGIVVALPGKLQLQHGWTASGVDHPFAIAASDDRVVVLDAMEDRAVIADLATGATTRIRTAATPIAALFAGREIYILARDASVLQRVGGPAIPLSRDPAFMRQAGGKVYVYSRAMGVVEEIEGDRVVRRLTVAPFASDFEVAGSEGFLVFPRESRIRTIDLARMETSGTVAVGAVPVDLDFAGGGSAITARILAVADPSARRVWLTESTQSTARAFGRGFLRGLLGLGLFGNRSSQFPTGVDRVVIRDRWQIAYDSSSGTLYRFDKRTSSVLARGVAPGAFAVTSEGVSWWDGEALRTAR
jgi:hypothetical protein